MRRLALSVLLAVASLLAPPRMAEAAGACATYSTVNTGDTLTADIWNQSFVTVAQTNMVWSCLDDYSTNVSQMQSTVDPYPASVASLATTGQGELERIRYVIKALTGWTQWYTHTETPTFAGTAPSSAKYVTQTTNATLTAEHSLGALTTGLLLNTVAAAEGTLSAYGGTSCTNQFVRSLNASGAATCASVSLTADITGTLALANGGTGLTSASDDTTLVSSGSAWVAKALPNCVAATEALQYATASNAFSCATISAGASAATQAEMEAASSTTVYASPGRTQYHPGVAKAWANFLNTTINASYNVTSVTDTATGDWTVNFTTAMSSTAYTAVATTQDDGNASFSTTRTHGTGGVRVYSFLHDGTARDPVTATDVVVFGDQ